MLQIKLNIFDWFGKVSTDLAFSLSVVVVPPPCLKRSLEALGNPLILSTHLLLEVHHLHEVLCSWREARSHLLHQTLHLLHVDAGAPGRAGLQGLKGHDDPTHQNTASAAQGEQLGHKAEEDTTRWLHLFKSMCMKKSFQGHLKDVSTVSTKQESLKGITRLSNHGSPSLHRMRTDARGSAVSYRKALCLNCGQKTEQVFKILSDIHLTQTLLAPKSVHGKYEIERGDDVKIQVTD